MGSRIIFVLRVHDESRNTINFFLTDTTRSPVAIIDISYSDFCKSKKKAIRELKLQAARNLTYAKILKAIFTRSEILRIPFSQFRQFHTNHQIKKISFTRKWVSNSMGELCFDNKMPTNLRSPLKIYADFCRINRLHSQSSHLHVFSSVRTCVGYLHPQSSQFSIVRYEMHIAVQQKHLMLRRDVGKCLPISYPMLQANHR